MDSSTKHIEIVLKQYCRNQHSNAHNHYRHLRIVHVYDPENAVFVLLIIITLND